MKKPKLSKMRTILIVQFFIIALLITSLAYVYGQSGNTFIISEGVYPAIPNYTIWCEDSTYYAKDTYGQSTSYGSNSTLAYETCRNLLTNGGLIYIKGLIVQSGSFVLTDYITIMGEGRGSTLQANGDYPVIVMSGLTGGVAKDLTIRGYSNTSSNSHGIKINAPATSCIVKDIWIHSTRHGIDVNGSFALYVHGVNIFGQGNDQNYIGVYSHATTLDTDGVWSGIMIKDTISHGFRAETFSGMRLIGVGVGDSGAKGFYFGEPSKSIASQFLHASNVQADNCAEEGFYFEGSGTPSGYIGSIQMNNIWSGSNSYGFVAYGLVNTVIDNVLFFTFDYDAIKLVNGFRVQINNGYIDGYGNYANNTYVGVRLINQSRCGVMNINFVASNPLDAIREEGTTDYSIIIANDLAYGGNATIIGANSIFEHNIEA